jgi:Aerotolerance regulator N-terminal/von Willebrand factor type A domain
MFLNPLLLACIGGAVVPLVLHLLSRARYRSVDWGAMMFLVGAEARQQQSTKLKQWLLLLLRMAIAAVLAIALARPALRGSLGGLAGAGRATAVIILDDSASMGYDQNGKTRLDQAREVVLQILAAMNRGDQVSLLLAGAQQSDAERAPTSDLQSIAARVSDLQPGYGVADMADALNRAGDLLDRYERLNREIYIVCDRQASSWKGVDSSFKHAWETRRSAVGAARVTLFDVGGDESDNVAVESAELVNPPAIKDQPADVEVRVHNFGTVPRDAMPLTLSINSRTLAETTVTLAANSEQAVKVPVRFPDGGSRVLTASVKSSGLTFDDRIDTAIDVTDPIKVLVISGDESGVAESNPPTFRSEASMLRLALSPYATTNQKGPDPAAVTIVPPGNSATADLDKFDVVIVANVERFTPAQARDLEQYVYGGGGILFAPGNVSRADDYNDTLFRGGTGILPASLQNPTPVDGSAATSLLGIDLNHPIFRFLKGRPEPIPSAAIVRYFPATPRTPDGRVLASYISGKPFLIESAAGRGRVLLVTTALDSDWSTLPLSNFYLPFVQSAVRYLAGAGTARRNLEIGQPIVASLDGNVDEKSVTIERPTDRQHQHIPATRFEDRTEVHYARTDEPGVYRLRYNVDGKEKQLHFVVNASRDESDLTPMTDDKWKAVQGDIGFERIDPIKTPVATAVARDRMGRELWPTLLGMVLVLAVVEMMLARMWSAEGG